MYRCIHARMKIGLDWLEPLLSPLCAEKVCFVANEHMLNEYFDYLGIAEIEFALGPAVRLQAKRAALAVNNSGAEVACAWYFEHSEDPDINAPPAAATAVAADAPDAEALTTLCSMGFAPEHVQAALKSPRAEHRMAYIWIVYYKAIVGR